jgi:hypothetical protein
VTAPDLDQYPGQPATDGSHEPDRDAKTPVEMAGRYTIWAALIGAVAAISAAVIGVIINSASPTPSPPQPIPPIRTSSPSALTTLSCSQKEQQWETTPSRQAITQFLAVSADMRTDASQDNMSALAADLQEVGNIASIMQTTPIPRCLEPQGYWSQISQQMQRMASEEPGVAAGNAEAVAALNADIVSLGRIAGNMNSELNKDKQHGNQ